MNWLDGSGNMQPLIATPGLFTTPRFSPDGRKVAFTRDGNVYVYDRDRETTAQLTFIGAAQGAIWAPDGKHILFRSGGSQLSWVRSDGAGDPVVLYKSRTTVNAWSFAPDGRLAYFESRPDTNFDIWTLPLDLSDPDHPNPAQPEANRTWKSEVFKSASNPHGYRAQKHPTKIFCKQKAEFHHKGTKAGQSELFLQTPAAELVPRFSPDGRWIAYRSNESGNNEIYVRPFPPGSGGKWQISTGGGLYGIWSPHGRELLSNTDSRTSTKAPYTTKPSIASSRSDCWPNGRKKFGLQLVIPKTA
jgi:serine/threonine-protein kinase